MCWGVFFLCPRTSPSSGLFKKKERCVGVARRRPMKFINFTSQQSFQRLPVGVAAFPNDRFLPKLVSVGAGVGLARRAVCFRLLAGEQRKCHVVGAWTKSASRVADLGNASREEL